MEQITQNQYMPTRHDREIESIIYTPLETRSVSLYNVQASHLPISPRTSLRLQYYIKNILCILPVQHSCCCASSIRFRIACCLRPSREARLDLTLQHNDFNFTGQTIEPQYGCGTPRLLADRNCTKLLYLEGYRTVGYPTFGRHEKRSQRTKYNPRVVNTRRPPILTPEDMVDSEWIVTGKSARPDSDENNF